MIWWAAQPSRGRSERAAIAELAEKSDWLENVTWRLTNDARLIADFEIRHLDQSIELSLTYPNFFPDTPPQVMPRQDIRLSHHQYGAGGELCLEYRPDNWLPEMTGAMMMESAHRLLSGERPAENETAVVASAHRLTDGQAFRNASFRMLLDRNAKTHLLALPQSTLIELEIAEHFYTKRWLAVPVRLGSKNDPIWKQNALVESATERRGHAYRLSDDYDGPVMASYDFLDALATAMKIDNLMIGLAESASEIPILIVHHEVVKLMSVSPGSGKRHVYDYRTIELPEAGARLSAEYDALETKSVAIVGCGSVGSKIAVALARSGVANFTLIDGDLFFPGNLVRNELDQRAIGLNKPDALAARLREINPAINTLVRKLTLGGQESSASTDSALKQMAACDLIIDATADHQIFNLSSSVARVDCKPMIWGEVFAGGIGGLIARSRPDVDPPPQLVRRQIAAWCEERGVPWTHVSSAQYDLPIDAEKPPLVADDADVGVIAAHMTRMAIDLLMRTDSTFPHSAYAVGLSAEWIFSAPFDTWPIELRPEGVWGPDKEENAAEELSALIEELFPDEASSAG